ncbi:hypothetical protein HON71_05115 [Candidatus Woesearchaeota archaeon]|jgi:hypothetical protein|nr:hypothetical protein [Candidatus Woesearchaeota archaeon]MBT5342100.1 hypothetical protein [Candidatus Woesearchaeota archaeon]
MTDKNTFKLKGIVDKGRKFELEHRKDLVKRIGESGNNLYVWSKLRWGTANGPLSEEHKKEFKILEQLAKSHDVNIWAGMHPGDSRYCSHPKDRWRIIDNAKHFLANGADGIYLFMDDTHPLFWEAANPSSSRHNVIIKDGKAHARLIKQMYEETEGKLKAICGEEYVGPRMSVMDYWEPILDVLPKDVAITWVGPGKSMWYRTLSAEDIPDLGWPVMLFDNYFASDSKKPERAPVYPYKGRDSSLTDKVEGIIINPNLFNYESQFCGLNTALDFLQDPDNYVPAESIKDAVTKLFVLYRNEKICNHNVGTNNPFKNEAYVDAMDHIGNPKSKGFRNAVIKLGDLYWKEKLFTS